MIVKRRPSNPTRTCLKKTGPPSVLRTTIAIIASNGESKANPAAARIISRALLKKPATPTTESCRLKLGNPGFLLGIEPPGDEFPNLDLEGFT